MGNREMSRLSQTTIGSNRLDPKIIMQQALLPVLSVV
jgi:hypothetical protein